MALAGEAEEAGQHALLCGHRALPPDAADTAFKRLALAGSVSREASRQQKGNGEVELDGQKEERQEELKQAEARKVNNLFGEWLATLKSGEDKVDQVNCKSFKLLDRNRSMNRTIHGKPL